MAAGEWDIVSDTYDAISTQSGYQEVKIMSERETITTDGRYPKKYELE